MKQEKYYLDQDITVLYLTASSFPEGIQQAHEKLHSLVPYPPERKFFGLSRKEEGIIRYQAAAEVITPDEAYKLGCPTLVIKKGFYLSVFLKDYQQNIQNIPNIFQALLATPNLDPEGYCVEWYISQKDMRCMVRLIK